LKSLVYSNKIINFLTQSSTVKTLTFQSIELLHQFLSVKRILVLDALGLMFERAYDRTVDALQLGEYVVVFIVIGALVFLRLLPDEFAHIESQLLQSFD
jgi:hypothetical protein